MATSKLSGNVCNRSASPYNYPKEVFGDRRRLVSAILLLCTGNNMAITKS